MFLALKVMYLCYILSSNPCLCCRIHYLVLHNSHTTTNLTAICDVSLLPSNPLRTPAVHLPTSVPPENRSAVCTLTAILEQVPVLNQCQLEDVWRIGRATFSLWEGSWRQEVYCGVSRRDWWKHKAIMHKRREIMEQPQRHNYQNISFFFFCLLNIWYFEIPIFDTRVLNPFKKETLLIQTNIIEDLF